MTISALAITIRPSSEVTTSAVVNADHYNGRPEGAPFEHYGPVQSAEAIRYAGRSLNSSTLKWPNGSQDDSAARK